MKTPENASVRLDWKRSLRLTAVLLLVIAVSALFLTLIHLVTAGRIAAREEESHRAALVSVMPGADVFSQLYCEDPTITGITGAYSGTRFMGYCVETGADGFGGPLRLMVGVSAGGAVTGVSILSHSETAELGAQVQSEEFLSQFLNKSGTITVNTGKNAIDGISGATKTSKAVAAAVNTALTAVLNYDAEGGLLPDGSEE